MEIAEIIQIIFANGGGVIFPIVMCLLLFKQNAELSKTIAENTVAIKDNAAAVTSLKELVTSLHK